MGLVIISLLAISLYLAAATRIGITLKSAIPLTPSIRTQVLWLGIAALIFHSIVLFETIMTAKGLNLGVFKAGSLVAWLMVLLLIIAGMKQPLENLTLILLPIAALCILLEISFPSNRFILQGSPLGLQLHILLSVLAYSLLTLAAFQAVMLSMQDYYLRKKKPTRIMQYLPPLQVMESLLFQIIAAGFFLLSLSLLSGFMFMQDITAQHLIHKTALSIVAWLVFLILLSGRWYFGWRGRVAVRYTLGGFVALMLAYFGSKFVLEIILQRV
jgi:ABC-type uncharacterized transport system permease subunit